MLRVWRRVTVFAVHGCSKCFDGAIEGVSILLGTGLRAF